jgi:hypothetical protein
LGELYREAVDIFICLEQFYKDLLVAWEIALHQQQSSNPDSSAIKPPINTPAFSFQNPFGTTFYHRQHAVHFSHHLPHFIRSLLPGH